MRLKIITGYLILCAFLMLFIFGYANESKNNNELENQISKMSRQSNERIAELEADNEYLIEQNILYEDLKRSIDMEGNLTDIGISPYEIEMMAKTIYGECRANDIEGKRKVIDVLMNRLHAQFGGNNSMKIIIEAKNQFHGYKTSNPVSIEDFWIVIDEINNWRLGRTLLSKDYLYFSGNGIENTFRKDG